MSILITRPEPAASELLLRLYKLGKIAWTLPLIEFIPGRDLQQLPEKLATLQPGDLVFFMSQQAVKFANPILQYNKMIWPKLLQYYAIGRSTALAINRVTNIKVYYPHKQENSEELIKIKCLQRIKGKNALILRSKIGRELLADTLKARGVKVQYSECYQRCKKKYDHTIEKNRWRNRNINTIIITSGEILQQLFTLFTPINHEEWLLSCKLLVVSERLANQAAKLGWKNIHIADSAHNDALIRALE
ncbi:uroporphyrinogen-III synthase [Candidatus Pantoea carbekii]|uniref:Uroporphyrinogen-III synthase n=1 Tax=Candidatus Pantoea carbekii TaxID=1235990 RepID=U3U8P1_9GAMM|nr:uroporphyrinogen-III synthase [Candidatus Pantoea carbekii]AKC32271.1 uroporphyrinogen-III synthase HemD [Candidatus Pantoea carbekii]BAN99982.1 HemD protein [Candidatus Pantoea carbekii]